MNATEIIKRLQQPTPDPEIQWIPTVKKKDSWMWTAYITGDYMRQAILQVSPAHDLEILDTWTDGECRMLRLSITLHGDDQDITVHGIGGADPKRNVSPANRWKAAKTVAMKNAMLELGLGLDLHGRSEWTKPDKKPTQQQSPLPSPASPTADADGVIETKHQMTPTEFWTAIRAMKIDQSLTREALARNQNNFAATLIELTPKAKPDR
jgi:hypothetical protein